MAKVVFFVVLLQLFQIHVICEGTFYQASEKRNVEILGRHVLGMPTSFGRRLLVENEMEQSDVEGELIFSDEQFSQVDKESESLSEESQELQNADESDQRSSKTLHKNGNGDKISFKENVIETEAERFPENKTLAGDKVHPKAETSKKSVNGTISSTTGELRSETEIDNTEIHDEDGMEIQPKEINHKASVDETISSTEGELESDTEAENEETHIGDAVDTKSRVHVVGKNKEEIIKGREGSAWQKEEDVEDKNEIGNANEMYVLSEEAEEDEVTSDDSEPDARLIEQNLQDFDEKKIDKGFRRNPRDVSKSKQVQSKKRVNSSMNLKAERRKKRASTKGTVGPLATLQDTPSNGKKKEATNSGQIISFINDRQPKEEQLPKEQEEVSSTETNHKRPLSSVVNTKGINQESSMDSKKKGRNRGSSMRVKRKVPYSSSVDADNMNQIRSRENYKKGQSSVSVAANGRNQAVPKETNKKAPLRASIQAKPRTQISEPRSRMDDSNKVKYSEDQERFTDTEDNSTTEELGTMNENDEQDEILDNVKESTKDTGKSSEEEVFEGSRSSSKQNFDVSEDVQSEDEEHLDELKGKQGQESRKEEPTTSLETEPRSNVTSIEADGKTKKRNEMLNPKPKPYLANANTKVETNQTIGEFPEEGIDDFSLGEKVVNESNNDDNVENLMEDFSDLPSKIQATTQTMADHLTPNLQRITNTSKEYFSKANQHITDGFSPIVGKRFAPFFASLISYGLLLVPLAVVIFVFEHINTLLPLHKVILFVNVYLAAYFGTLMLVTLVVEEPMAFFYRSSSSGYIQLQLLQALGYVIYLILLSIDVISSCSLETLPVKLTVLSQWLFAVGIGFHYYATVFVRAMLQKPPHTNWKMYGIYCFAFSILCLFSRVRHTKKVYAQLRHTDTNKSN